VVPPALSFVSLQRGFSPALPYLRRDGRWFVPRLEGSRIRVDAFVADDALEYRGVFQNTVYAITREAPAKTVLFAR
ncbi:MAG: hypothetical protein ACK4N5_07810, partial [Myxococcales bacterium]